MYIIPQYVQNAFARFVFTNESEGLVAEQGLVSAVPTMPLLALNFLGWLREYAFYPQQYAVEQWHALILEQCDLLQAEKQSKDRLLEACNSGATDHYLAAYIFADTLAKRLLDSNVVPQTAIADIGAEVYVEQYKEATEGKRSALEALLFDGEQALPTQSNLWDSLLNAHNQVIGRYSQKTWADYARFLRAYDQASLRDHVDAAMEQAIALTAPVLDWGGGRGHDMTCSALGSSTTALGLLKAAYRVISGYPLIRDLVVKAGEIKGLAAPGGKVNWVPQELESPTLGADLERLDPSELATKTLMPGVFVDRLSRRGLRQTSGVSLAPKSSGPVVILLDCSGSMDGDVLFWAKATTFALVDQIRSASRVAIVLPFNSAPRPLKHGLFDNMITGDPLNPAQWLNDFGRSVKDRICGLTEIANVKASGGTSFTSALDCAVSMVASNLIVGKSKASSHSSPYMSPSFSLGLKDADIAMILKGADIVMITDGEDELGEGFVAQFSREKSGLRIKLHLIQIGSSDAGEIATIADSNLRVSPNSKGGADILNHLEF